MTAAKSLQSCPTMCDLMDCSLPGSSIHRIFQARVLEWGVIAFSSQNDYTTLKNLQIQCNPYPYQIVNGIFHSIQTNKQKKKLTLCMETQKSLNNQSYDQCIFLAKLY